MSQFVIKKQKQDREMILPKLQVLIPIIHIFRKYLNFIQYLICLGISLYSYMVSGVSYNCMSRGNLKPTCAGAGV